VRPDGVITMPLIGDLPVAGKTPTQVREEMKKRLSSYLKADATGTNITLRFPRQALVDAGVLTPTTTQLDVIGDLTTGMQIVSQVPFSVK